MGFPGHSMGFPGNSMGFPGNSMGCQQPHGSRPRDPGVGHGCGAMATARSLQSPCGSPLPGFQENRCRARGSQYCSNAYQCRLSKHGFKGSPLAHVNIGWRAADERQGHFYGNSMVLRRGNAQPGPFLILRFFNSIKAALIRRHQWDTGRPPKGVLAIALEPMANKGSLPHITGFYTPRRRHSSLDGKAPWQSNERPNRRAERPECKCDRSS